MAFSMLLVALSAPYLGSWADRLGAHRGLLGGFSLFGAIATCFLYLAQGNSYILAAVLFILANIGFALANIFYNSFLPILADKKGMDRLSARGFGLGYIGGGLALALVALAIYKHQFFGLETRAMAMRLGFLFTGIWWIVFALPSFLLLGKVKYPRRMSAIPPGLKGYLRILSEISGYRDLLLFLIAFLLYNDGIQTIIAVSAVFAREVLELSPASILGCFLMVQFVAMPGALAFGRLSEVFGAKRAVMSALILFMGVTIYAFFIDSDLEFWIMGFVVALILGGSQAASRSLFGGLIPVNRSAEFFGFYTLSGKFASILGPFIFGFIADLTGSIRIAILILNLFFLSGIMLLALVNVRRGRSMASSEIS